MPFIPSLQRLGFSGICHKISKLEINIHFKQKLQSLRIFLEETKLPVGIVFTQSDRVEMLAPKIIQIPISVL